MAIKPTRFGTDRGMTLIFVGLSMLAFMSATMLAPPWKSPQSMKIFFPALLRRCLLPVTVPAAPTNVSSAI